MGLLLKKTLLGFPDLKESRVLLELPEHRDLLVVQLECRGLMGKMERMAH